MVAEPVRGLVPYVERALDFSFELEEAVHPYIHKDASPAHVLPFDGDATQPIPQDVLRTMHQTQAPPTGEVLSSLEDVLGNRKDAGIRGVGAPNMHRRVEAATVINTILRTTCDDYELLRQSIGTIETHARTLLDARVSEGDYLGAMKSAALCDAQYLVHLLENHEKRGITRQQRDAALDEMIRATKIIRAKAIEIGADRNTIHNILESSNVLNRYKHSIGEPKQHSLLDRVKRYVSAKNSSVRSIPPKRSVQNDYRSGNVQGYAVKGNAQIPAYELFKQRKWSRSLPGRIENEVKTTYTIVAKRAHAFTKPIADALTSVSRSTSSILSRMSKPLYQIFAPAPKVAIDRYVGMNYSHSFPERPYQSSPTIKSAGKPMGESLLRAAAL